MSLCDLACLSIDFTIFIVSTVCGDVRFPLLAQTDLFDCNFVFVFRSFVFLIQ